MIRVHNLKIEGIFYAKILNEAKCFELRKNDRNYQVGDYINFEVLHRDRYIDQADEDGIYHEDTNTLYLITDILEDYAGLEKDYCILNIKYVGKVEKFGTGGRL